jgi:hypothetical protein
MDYFAGLDISMDETHVCVVDREGSVIHQGWSSSTAEAIADKLAKAPSSSDRLRNRSNGPILFLFHGLSQLGLPVRFLNEIDPKRSYGAIP